MRRQESGLVLFTVLLFLVVITVLVLAMLNTSLLETKMGSNYFATMHSFYAAESKLKQKELELLMDKKSATEVVLIQQVCGVDFYRVSVDVTGGGTLKLQSVIAKMGDTGKCNPQPKMRSGRQSLVTVNG